jgi:hypothetical protein
VHAHAPIPERHTLPVAHADVWFGTLPSEELQLVAVPFKAPPAEPDAQLELVDEPGPRKKQPWQLDDSIFAPRKRTCDARAYYTTRAVLERGFALDWGRCVSARFQRLVAREDDGGVLGLADELQEVRAALLAHVETLYSVYGYYCATGDAYDGFCLGLNEFSRFVDDCEIPEPASKGCRKTDLLTIFISACSAEDPAVAALGLDRALLRHQWLQVIVRIAIAKFVHSGETGDVSDALDFLVSEFILPNVSPSAKHDHDRFRRQQLYTERTELVRPRARLPWLLCPSAPLRVCALPRARARLTLAATARHSLRPIARHAPCPIGCVAGAAQVRGLAAGALPPLLVVGRRRCGCVEGGGHVARRVAPAAQGRRLARRRVHQAREQPVRRLLALLCCRRGTRRVPAARIVRVAIGRPSPVCRTPGAAAGRAHAPPLAAPTPDRSAPRVCPPSLAPRR